MVVRFEKLVEPTTVSGVGLGLGLGLDTRLDEDVVMDDAEKKGSSTKVEETK